MIDLWGKASHAKSASGNEWVTWQICHFIAGEKKLNRAKWAAQQGHFDLDGGEIPGLCSLSLSTVWSVMIQH